MSFVQISPTFIIRKERIIHINIFDEKIQIIYKSSNSNTTYEILKLGNENLYAFLSNARNINNYSCVEEWLKSPSYILRKSSCEN
jgi:hypothetical protein